MDDRLISYLYFFNVERDYYECHEYGEMLWLESGRPIVLKGLIQAAVCLYHLNNGNVKGGYRMWQRARTYISGERPLYQGIDLDHLTDAIDDVFARVPKELYNVVVAPTDVKRLNLPEVTIKLVDPNLAARLPTWVPTPLDAD